jgi:hypothetical protein
LQQHTRVTLVAMCPLWLLVDWLLICSTSRDFVVCVCVCVGVEFDRRSEFVRLSSNWKRHFSDFNFFHRNGQPNRIFVIAFVDALSSQ